MMEEGHVGPDAWVYFWRILATFAFVLLNGFFVAAEFAMVKVQAARVQSMVLAGSSRAHMVQHILRNLDRYLSACQLGITLSSLILGWLAEPAVADLLLRVAAAFHWEISPTQPWIHAAALAVALSIVTVLHMTLGEQAPKIWAIKRADTTAVAVAFPLHLFAQTFRPVIWLINSISNGLLRLAGIRGEELADTHAPDAQELRHVLAASAEGGHITSRQLELAQNVLDIIGLEVRHIMVPRVDVEYLTLQAPFSDSIQKLRESGHSRFPLCAVGLDSVIGIVHAKEVMRAVADGEEPDLKRLARKPVFVSDTQPVSRLIFQLQRTRNHCCVVLDEHGTTIGLAFLEDALEEIVGPIQDEFDEVPEEVIQLASGSYTVPGGVALPEAADALALSDLTEEADTIGGYVVALLGRLPRRGDTLTIGRFRVTVTEVVRRRVERLRFDPIDVDAETES